jgi:DNA-binding transcriptional regulator YiaG
MASVLFKELGFPILLINSPMIRVRGELVPDVNFKDLQRAVFCLLVVKPSRLSGAEIRFVRKYLRLRQSDLAEVLNMANHSVVSQWESREDEPAGMDYNTEVLLRIWMAARAGQEDRVIELLESRLKALKPRAERPLEVQMSIAA